LDELKDVDVSKLKLDPAFLQYLSEVIENQVKKKSDSEEYKPSKMDILIEIVKRLFPQISDPEIESCRGIVEFILANKLVKKVPLSKIMSYYLKKRFSLGSA
jgi:hypothetical protein